MKRLPNLLNGLALATSGGRSQDGVTTAGPNEYQLKHRISSPTPPVSDYIRCDKECGGTITVNSVPLPASYRFRRTMQQSYHMVLASLDGDTTASKIPASILLDGRAVQKETGHGAIAPSGPVYLIGQ